MLQAMQAQAGVSDGETFFLLFVFFFLLSLTFASLRI